MENINFFDRSTDDCFVEIIYSTYLVKISKNLLTFISDTYQQSNEQGGYLIGYKVSDVEDDQITIFGLSTPHKRDIKTSASFCISKQHKKQVNTFLKRDKTFMTFGFWHTHPGSYPALPSQTDMKLFQEIFEANKQFMNFHIIKNVNKTNFIIFRNNKVYKEIECQL